MDRNYYILKNYVCYVNRLFNYKWNVIVYYLYKIRILDLISLVLVI